MEYQASVDSTPTTKPLTLPTTESTTERKPQVHVALDFDGTITVGDTGDDLFRTFGAFEPLHSQLLGGQMSVAEYYLRAVRSLTADATPQAVHSFALGRQVDPGFLALVELCERHRAHVSVVSDGFDVYITPILEQAGCGHLPVACNTLQHTDEQWHVAFPGASESCSCFCASCKRNALLATVHEHDLIVFVGDGRSDRCAVKHADVVFAKDNLAAWCTEQRIPHHPWRTLHDVARVLGTKFATQALRPRRQAQLARKAAYETE